MKLGGSYATPGLEMAKPLLNGSGPGVDVSEEDAVAAATMAAAIQGLASCTKNMQDGNFSGIEIKEERFSCDFDHMYASMAEHDSVAAAAAAEVRQLKELLLLHLDLIQQQSDQIVNKDKQLQILRQENEMLRSRIERMDRRVTLHHNKKQPPTDAISVNPTEESSAPLIPNVPFCEEDSLSVPAPPICKVERSPSPQESPLPVVSKQLALPERASRSRKSSWSSDTGTAASRRSAGSDRVMESRKNSLSPAALPPAPKRYRGARRQTTENNAVDREVKSVNVISTPRLPKSPLSALTTKKAYCCPTIGSDDEDDGDQVEESAQRLLEVPRWRVKVYTSCYSMEGTENLEDDVFLKRHQRLELDERRRKRWDIQRLREQRQCEKLRQRQTQQQQVINTSVRRGPGSSGAVSTSASMSRNNNNKKQPEEPTQLWPDLEQVQYIEVEENIPVTAFGVSMPAFLPVAFELPWSAEVGSLELEDDHGTELLKIKEEPEDLPPAPPPPSPDIPTPTKSTPTSACTRSASAAAQASRRRSRGNQWETRRISTRRR